MKLHLHLNTRYFNEIKAGTKTEEYREYNDYWIRNIVGPPGRQPRDFDGIVIYNAYRPGPENRIEFPWRGWSLKKITHPHFGPNEVNVFAIKLQTHSAWAREITARNIAALHRSDGGAAGLGVAT